MCQAKERIGKKHYCGILSVQSEQSSPGVSSAYKQRPAKGEDGCDVCTYSFQLRRPCVRVQDGRALPMQAPRIHEPSARAADSCKLLKNGLDGLWATCSWLRLVVVRHAAPDKAR